MADHLLHLYGSETGRLLGYSKVKDNALERITSGAPDIWAQVYHAVREEWALTAEDVIYRRTTLGLRGFDTPEIRQRISTVLEAGANTPAHVPLWLRPGKVPQREVVD
jgi:glycerol-3-phosphate dehydrogenase